MRQTKLSLLLLLALVMSATRAFAQAVGSSFTVDKITYTITSNDLNHHVNNTVAVAYIGGSGDVTVPSEVTNPDNHESYKVTSSTDWTGCSNDITSLTFSEGYTTMGGGCYRFASNLEKVTFPASFTAIGPSCFENCPKFTQYAVAGGNNTFQANSQGWLLSKDGTTLWSCPSGTQGDVAIPEGVTTLAKTAFKVCPSIRKVSIPKSLASINQGTDASLYAVGSYFDVDDNNPYFKDEDGVLLTKDCKTLVSFPPLYDETKLENGGKYTLPASVETVASEAFNRTKGYLKTVDLNNAKTLMEEAFSWPEGLESVNIGKDVSSIKDGAFFECLALKKFTVDDQNQWYMDKDDMIYSKDERTLVLCPTGRAGDYAIPEGTISVAGKAFYGAAITGVTLPSTLKIINGQAFRFCRDLRTLDFGTDSHLETIFGTAFSSTGLTGTVTIPASVKRLDERVFYNTNISSIHISDGSQLTEIRSQAFDELPELESFVFDGTSQVTFIGENAFANDMKLMHFTIPASVTTIGNSAFLNTPAMESVEFKEPASIHTIGNGAFGGSGIKSITLPESVTTIVEQAFDGCKNLETIAIPKNVTEIKSGAFNFCEKLKSFVVDDANQKYSTVDGILCTKDKKTLVTFPAGKADTKYTSLPFFEEIGSYAFYNSKAITNVTIPRTVTTIDTRAFALCDNLTSLSFMGTEHVPTLSADILYSSPKPENVSIYVRKAWYEAPVNQSTVNGYNSIFKEVHPSFIAGAVSGEGYDRGVEFFPTSTSATGAISFYTPRTSVIIGKTATEEAYTDTYGKHWPETTYNVSAILDFAFEATTPDVKMVTVLADINNIGLDAFKAPTLKELYFVGNTPATLSSTSYSLPDNYPFNAGQAVYVKQSKVDAYKAAWNVDNNHKTNIGWQIPQQTNKNGGSVCYPFDVVYPQEQGANDIKPYVPKDYDHAYDASNPFVRAYSIDNYYVPAFVGALIRSKNALSVNSYCQMDENQAHDKSALDALGYSTDADNRMVGAVEDTPITNESGYQYYAFSKSQSKFVKLNDGANFPYFKAYFRMASSSVSPAKGFSIMFDDDNTVTGIDGIVETDKGSDNAPYFNLNGIQVSKPSHGVYIQNGKKVIIK